MFPEISLHILDIAQNSIKAGADFIQIRIQIQTQTERIRVEVKDNGRGMDEAQLFACADPFFTTRTTGRVGLGIPFLKQSAECTGGTFSVSSVEGRWTELVAEYHTDHIDCIPLGDINATIYALVIMNETLDFLFEYQVNERQFVLDTREMRGILGDIPFGNNEISSFIREFLNENKKETEQGIIF